MVVVTITIWDFVHASEVQSSVLGCWYLSTQTTNVLGIGSLYLYPLFLAQCSPHSRPWSQLHDWATEFQSCRTTPAQGVTLKSHLKLSGSQWYLQVLLAWGKWRSLKQRLTEAPQVTGRTGMRNQLSWSPVHLVTPSKQESHSSLQCHCHT